MMNNDIQKIGDNWTTQSMTLASDANKKLILSVRFDGNGNSIVRFVIRQPDTMDINFEKSDAAVDRYNSMP